LLQILVHSPDQRRPEAGPDGDRIHRIRAIRGKQNPRDPRQNVIREIRGNT
jgi:hypothetical protein